MMAGFKKCQKTVQCWFVVLSANPDNLKVCYTFYLVKVLENKFRIMYKFNVGFYADKDVFWHLFYIFKKRK